MALFQFDEVETWLQACLTTANSANIKYFHDLASKEIKRFNQHKERLLSHLKVDKAPALADQEELFKEYLEEAMNSLKRFGEV